MSDNPVASSLISVSSTPTDPSLVWALPMLSVCDWSGGVTLATTWRSTIRTARTAAEQRFALGGKPTRLISYNLIARDSKGLAAMNEAVRRHGISRALIPIMCDGTPLSSQSAATATFNCDPTFKRFYPGGRFVVAKSQAGPERDTFEVLTIASKTSTSITSSAACTGTYPAGSVIYPLIEAEVSQDNRGRYLTRDSAVFSIQAREIAGPSCLPPWLHPSDTSPYPTRDSYPVFCVPGGFGEVAAGTISGMLSANIGRGTIYTRIGARPRTAIDGSGLHIGRQAAVELSQFFDYRQGRVRGFIAVHPSNLFRVVSVSGANVAVFADLPVNGWDAMPYFAAMGADGVPVVRKINSVTRDTTVDSLVLDGALGLTKPQIARATFAFVSRFNSDEMTESWITDDLVSVNWSIAELLEEKTVELST